MATKKKFQQVVTIKSNEESPEPVELIVASIVEVAAGFKKMQASRLKRRAILLLIRDVSNVGMTEIERVLDAAAELEKHFIKPVVK